MISDHDIIVKTMISWGTKVPDAYCTALSAVAHCSSTVNRDNDHLKPFYSCADRLDPGQPGPVADPA